MPRLGLVVLGGADGRVKMRVRSVRVLGELRHQLPEDGRFQTTWPGRRGWGRGLPQPLGVGAGGVASCYPCTGSGLGAWPPVTRPRGRATGLGAWPPSAVTPARGRGVGAGGRWRLVHTEACASPGRSRRPALVFLFFGPASLQTGQAPLALGRLMTDFAPVSEERAVWFTSSPG